MVNGRLYGNIKIGLLLICVRRGDFLGIWVAALAYSMVLSTKIVEDATT